MSFKDLLKEKNATFVEDVNTRLEGNTAIIPRPGGDIEEDGSLEVSGTLYTDVLRSATFQDSIVIGDRFNFQERPAGSLPPQGKMQIYSSDSHDSRIVMANYQGKVIDLNPLQNRGDIMVYDSITDTTTRLPVGLHDQVLSVGTNTGQALQWNTQNKRENILLEPSDNYIKHLLLENENVNGPLITTNFTFVDFTIVKRKDSAFTLLSPSVVQFSETGNYHINIRLAVFLDDTFTDIANIEAVLQDDSAGFADIDGTQMYAMIAGGVPGSNIVTLSTQVVVAVTAGRQFRVGIREINTSDGTIRVLPNSCTFIAQKVYINTDTSDTSEFVFVHGPVGSQTVTVSTAVNIDTVVTKTNGSDSLVANEIVFNGTGLRHVWGKITLSSTNLAANENVRMKLALTKNSTEITSSVSEVSMVVDSGGIITSNSGYTQALVSFNSTDTLGMEVTILSQSAAGTIILDTTSCSMGSIMYSFNNTPSPSIWEKIDTRVLLLKNIPNNNYYDIPFDTNNIINSNFTYNTTFPGLIQCTSHGTYSLFFKCAVLNNSAETLNTGLRILVYSGSGFQELNRTYASIRPGLSHGLVLNQLIHLSANSILKIQVLGSTDNLQIVADSASIMLYRIENTISTSFGQNIFGSYYQFESDPALSQTTSTTLIPFLTMTTSYIHAGDYRISWEFDWNMSNGGQKIFSELHLDAVKIDEFSDIPLDTSTFKRINNFTTYTFTSGIHVLEILLSVESSNRTLSIKNLRLELIRTE
jgi:hypothetical protein